MYIECLPSWASRRCSKIVICKAASMVCLSRNNRHLGNGICLPFLPSSIVLANSGKGTTLLTRLIDALAFVYDK